MAQIIELLETVLWGKVWLAVGLKKNATFNLLSFLQLRLATGGTSSLLGFGRDGLGLCTLLHWKSSRASTLQCSHQLSS